MCNPAIIKLRIISLTYFLILSIGCTPSKTVSTKENKQNEIFHHPLQTEKDLDVLMKEIGDARVVLLGESTHGTHEYYHWRSVITKRLVEEKGFQFIGIEGDWVDT